MSLHIIPIPEDELEFQMFVFDELADQLCSAEKDVIKLTIGISELEVPNNVLQAFSKFLYDYKKSHVVYPQGVPELREAIANYYNQNYGSRVSMENIIVSHGTSTIFRNLFQLCCERGKQILIPKPYYCLYLLSGILAGAKICYYNIDPVDKRVDLESFQKAYHPDKTGIVVINNPGNPMGNILSKDEIIEINRIVDGRSFIVNDEIYNNMCFYSDYECPLGYLDDYHETNIVTNGFSKGFRMYTKRIGYAILPERLIAPMRIIQQHTLLTCDPVYQFGMIEALRDTDSPVELRQLYRQRAEYTCQELQNTGCYPIGSDGGFYIILDCTKWIKQKGMKDSKDLARDILLKTYVATVPGTDFGLPCGLRLSFCASRYNEAIDRLKVYFTSC